jgi:hypothetical protein
MENNKRLNYDLLDLEISNQKNQKNHSADNVNPLPLRSSFRNPCQQGVLKKVLESS